MIKSTGIISAAIAVATLCTTSIKVDACTNILITPGASKDGSTLISYAADSHVEYGYLHFRRAASWNAGSKLKINEWDSGKYLGEIDQVGATYKVVGNMNEHQLIIGETTFGGREELFDARGGIDYGSMIYVALERARTAREAIKVMVDLANTYGYHSSGESFSIGDTKEVWLLEMIGKGDEKGVVWVARRVPDGYICAHANQSRITTFPLDDPQNCMYSEDVISFARKKGYFNGEDKDFSFRDAYNPLDFGGARFCDARAWSALNILGKGKFTFEDENGKTIELDANDFLDYAMGYKLDMKMPLWIKPAEKITVKNVADAMRDHYEGTPMDMRQDIGGGGNACPYRWRPMEWEYDGKTYLNERAIATQQTGFWFVGQARGWMPDVIGGIIWFATDDAATSYVTPIYTNITTVPGCIKEGNGNLITYSPTSSFWLNNRVANACYRMYNQMEPYVRKKIDEFENAQLYAVKSIDSNALQMYENTKAKVKNEDPMSYTGILFTKIKAYLTNYSVDTAQDQFKEWKKLEEDLLVKFMDGNVKVQDESGRFIPSEDDPGRPAEILHPEYTDFWKAATASKTLEVK